MIIKLVFLLLCIVANNLLASEGFRYLIEALTALQDLNHLEISFKGNRLGIAGMQFLNEKFKKPDTLKEMILDLAQTEIGNMGFKEIGEFLSKNSDGLKTLALSIAKNDITFEAAEYLFPALDKLTSLEKLGLNFAKNQIGVQGANELGQRLGKLKNLTFLSLNFSENKVGFFLARALAEPLSQLKSLETFELMLHKNYIGYDGILLLSNVICKWQALHSLRLNLSLNAIGKEGCDRLMERLVQCPGLKELELKLNDSNYIDDEGADVIASSLRKMKSLNKLLLALADNELTQKGIEHISHALKVFEGMGELTFDLDPQVSKNDQMSEDKTTVTVSFFKAL